MAFVAQPNTTITYHMDCSLYYRLHRKVKRCPLPAGMALQAAMVCASVLCAPLAYAQHPPSGIDTPPAYAEQKCDTAASSETNQEEMTEQATANDGKDKDNACLVPRMRLRALLTLRCKKNKNDALCAQLVRDKRQLTKAERTELRHALREYARQAGIHKSKHKP